MGSLAAQGLSLPIALLCFTFFHPVKQAVHLDELMFKKKLYCDQILPWHLEWEMSN